MYVFVQRNLYNDVNDAVGVPRIDDSQFTAGTGSAVITSQCVAHAIHDYASHVNTSGDI